MIMKGVLLVLLVLLSGYRVGRAHAVVQTLEPADKRPHIILVLADDLGYGDLSSYGNEVNRTPHLDRLAAEGLRFTDFHANGPMCTPTRAALLTSLYQNRFGRSFETALSPKTDRDDGLPHEVLTVAEALRAAGYATGMYGKWHLGYQPPNVPTAHGFDDFRGLLTGDGDHHSHISRSGEKDWWHNEQVEMEEGYSVDLITQHSIDFLKRHQEEPSFIYVAHLAIHFPWQGSDEERYRVEGAITGISASWGLTRRAKSTRWSGAWWRPWMPAWGRSWKLYGSSILSGPLSSSSPQTMGDTCTTGTDSTARFQTTGRFAGRRRTFGKAAIAYRPSRGGRVESKRDRLPMRQH